MNRTTTMSFAVGLIVGLVVSYIVSNYSGLHEVHQALRKHRHHTYGAADGDAHKDVEGHVFSPASHEEVDDVKGPKNVYQFNDKKFHEHDDDSVAKFLKKKVRVLCWIMTGPQNLQSKARHVRATWGKRCNKLLFMSSKTDTSFPAVGLDVAEGRNHLTAKTMRAFKYVYDHHLNEYDWFMKADDDTYVIVENLRYLLASKNASEPVYFGHHFKVIVKQGYTSGGAGYIISREALRRFAEKGYNKGCSRDGGAEDVEMGRCLESLGVKVGDSRDAGGRSRFHCFTPETHLFGGYPDWYRQYDKYGAKHGEGNISDYSITFHYVNPNTMYALEFYIYHLRPYGIMGHSMHLNTDEKDHSHHHSLEKEAHVDNKKETIAKKNVARVKRQVKTKAKLITRTLEKEAHVDNKKETIAKKNVARVKRQVKTKAKLIARTKQKQNKEKY